MTRSYQWSLSPLALFTVMISFLSATPALSGAYLENRETGLLMIDVRIDHARASFSATGQLTSSVIFDRVDTTSNLEWGLNDRVTVLLSTGATKATYEDETGYNYYSGRSVTEVGARFKLIRGADWILSAQTTELVPINTSYINSAVATDTLEQQDLRLLLGKNFVIGTRYPLYAEIQIGERFRQSTSTENHIDTSLAWRPLANVMFLAQTFWTHAPASGLSPDLSQTKAELSIIYDISRSLAFQIGGFDTVSARNALSEHGVIAGLWIHF